MLRSPRVGAVSARSAAEPSDRHFYDRIRLVEVPRYLNWQAMRMYDRPVKAKAVHWACCRNSGGPHRLSSPSSRNTALAETQIRSRGAMRILRFPVPAESQNAAFENRGSNMGIWQLASSTSG